MYQGVICDMMYVSIRRKYKMTCTAMLASTRVVLIGTCTIENFHVREASFPCKTYMYKSKIPKETCVYVYYIIN